MDYNESLTELGKLDNYERIADFRAQIAACHKGTKELEHIISRYGLDTVMEYMGYIQENSEYSVKKALHRFLADGSEFYSVFEDNMDDGTIIKARIVIDGGTNPPETLRAVIDFSGTGQRCKGRRRRHSCGHHRRLQQSADHRDPSRPRGRALHRGGPGVSGAGRHRAWPRDVDRAGLGPDRGPRRRRTVSVLR